MSARTPIFSFWKGPVFAGLEALSKRDDARDSLRRMARALSDIASGGYDHLETIFDHHILAPLKVPASDIQIITGHFKQHFFDSNASDGYFPHNHHLATIWGAGFLRTIETSLKGSPNPLPIDAWWIVDCTEVKVITLVSDQQITMLACTPRPAKLMPHSGSVASFEGYTTARLGVVTREY